MVKQTINPVAVVVFLLLTATVVASTGLGAPQTAEIAVEG